MRHRQREELRERLRVFFEFSHGSLGARSDDDLTPSTLVVYEPESRAQFFFTWRINVQANRPIERSAEMHFIWPRFGESERDLAHRLGLPAPLSTVKLPIHLSGGARLPDLTVCPIRDPEQAAEVCLMVLEQVFTSREERWLWITDVVAREAWPNPLPKPNVWPPVAKASGEP